MFKKILATLGIGAVKVDTILETEYLQPGQFFNAEIVIKGGEVKQEISNLHLTLMTKVKEVENGEVYLVDHVIEKWKISDTCIVDVNEIKRIPFEARLHAETPVTELQSGLNQSKVWLATGINIDNALGANDIDLLFIHPNEAISTFMKAMERLEFKLIKTSVEKGILTASNFRSVSGCYQELVYKPMAKSIFNLKEIEVSFISETHRTHVLIEVDRALNSDGYVDLTIEHDQVSQSQICDQLEHLLK